MKILILLCLFFSSSLWAGYNVIDRFKIVEDKFKTQDMLNPIGHDFFLDIGGALNADVFDLVSDIGDIDDKPTESEKKDAALEMFNRLANTEQNLRVKIGLGFPLPSFTAWGVRIEPNFRVGVNIGMLMGIRKETITLADIMDFIGSEIDGYDDVKACVAQISAANLSDANVNYDIMKAVQLTACYSSLTPVEQAVIKSLEGEYFFPSDITGEVPNLHLMMKVDGKAGFYIDYFKDEWFGFLNLAVLARTDFSARVASEAFAAGRDLVDLPEEPNLQGFAVLDYKLGRKLGRFSVMGSIEDLKLSRVYDNLEKGGDLNYGTDPLFRLHGDAHFDWAAFSLIPFVGLHKRTGYGFEDGVYAGADWGAHVFGKRFGTQVRTMVDNAHFTLSQRLKLWLLQLEAMAKFPLKTEVDDVKVPTIYSFNLRLAF